MKKRIIYGVMILLATVYCSGVMAYSGGNGSEESPFLISSPADFQQLTDKVNKEYKNYAGVYFLLTCDLTRVTTIIGDEMPFSGIFDGGGHKITANIKSRSSAGIFGKVRGATIKNLSVSGNISGGYAGGIFGEGVANVSNCYNSAQIQGFAGGICGMFIDENQIGGSITNCHNSGDISGHFIGGICGYFKIRISYPSEDYNYSINYCSNSGKVSGDIVGGGICGELTGEVGDYNPIRGQVNFILRIGISNCYNTGDVTISGAAGFREQTAYSGGIAGNFNLYKGEAEINNCYNSGAIDTPSGAEIASGGIVGIFKNPSGKINNCYNVGNITGKGIQDEACSSIVGSICGLNGNIIKNCFAVNTEIKCNTTKSSTGRIVGSSSDNDGFGKGLVAVPVISGERKIENCHALSSMTVNGKTRSSSASDSNDGQDQDVSVFKDAEWIKKNLGWDFEIWSLGNSEFPYPTIE
jgi:hypothetical protein